MSTSISIHQVTKVSTTLLKFEANEALPVSPAFESLVITITQADQDPTSIQLFGELGGFSSILTEDGSIPVEGKP